MHVVGWGILMHLMNLPKSADIFIMNILNFFKRRRNDPGWFKSLRQKAIKKAKTRSIKRIEISDSGRVIRVSANRFDPIAKNIAHLKFLCKRYNLDFNKVTSNLLIEGLFALDNLKIAGVIEPHSDIYYGEPDVDIDTTYTNLKESIAAWRPLLEKSYDELCDLDKTIKAQEKTNA